MIHATFPAAVLTAGEASGTTRTVAGVAVPWDVEGQVSDGRVIRFARGSLDATARPLLLRDHDRTRPLGKVTDATEADSGMLVSASISRTRDGDEALVLAADGVLGAFSVGVNPTKHHYEDDVLVVDAGEWQELSLLTFGAFPGAAVATVAAAPGPDIDVPIDDPDEEEDPEPEDPEEDPEEEPDVSTITDPVPAVAAGAPAILPLTTNAPPVSGPEALTISGLARMIAAGAKGADIMAALTNVVSPSGASGVVRPAAVGEVRGLVEFGRPVINAINRAPLPPAGMSVEYPVWTDLPDVGIQSPEKTAITSGAAALTVATAAVQTWAGGNDISLQAVQRSNPSFVEAYIRAAAEQFARQTELYVETTILAAAAAVAPAATFLDSIEALVSAFSPTLVPAGSLFLAMSWDVGATMIGVPVNSGPAFWDGSISLNSTPTTNSAGGLNMFVARQLPAKTALMGVSSGATWYEDPANPQEIRVVDVSLLGLDVAVYGFGALAVEVPDAFKKMTFTTLPTALQQSGPAKK